MTKVFFLSEEFRNDEFLILFYDNENENTEITD